MQVLDIVQSAAFKAGIIPSFNPDELPDDVLNAGVAALTNEILPSLNCDRTIDITVTSRIYKPVNNTITLTPFKQPAEDFVILGRYNANWEYIVDHMVSIIENTYHVVTSPWPVDELGNYIKYAVWSIDNRLVWTTYNEIDVMPEEINIDFPPMRIEGVLENSSRIPYEYRYRDEFEQAKPLSALPGIYTTEEYDNSITVLLNGTPAPKCLIIPVPLQIINADHARSGIIKAPDKFRRYLIDCTAVSLAIIYGVSTVAAMQQQAGVSYNLLKKNKPQPLHKAEAAKELAEKLRNSPLAGRRYYAGL